MRIACSAISVPGRATQPRIHAPQHHRPPNRRHHHPRHQQQRRHPHRSVEHIGQQQRNRAGQLAHGTHRVRRQRTDWIGQQRAIQPNPRHIEGPRGVRGQNRFDARSDQPQRRNAVRPAPQHLKPRQPGPLPARRERMHKRLRSPHGDPFACRIRSQRRHVISPRGSPACPAPRSPSRPSCLRCGPAPWHRPAPRPSPLPRRSPPGP